MTMNTLREKKCQPCQGIGKPLDGGEVRKYLALTPGWKVSPQGKEIYREYLMKNFMAGILAIDRVAEIAEAENHHPDIHLTGYRRLKITLSTHELGGLSENDFIVAAKINALTMELKK